MTYQVLAEIAPSISELKSNPMKVAASGHGIPIVVLNRNLIRKLFQLRLKNRHFGRDRRNPEAMEGLHPCNLNTGNPCRYDAAEESY